MDNGDLAQRAVDAVDRERVAELCAALVGVPSPTGAERPLAEWIVDELTASRIAARVQPIDDQQANAVGWLGSSGDGADLLLYAPIDTLTVGETAADVPWIGDELPTHAQAQAQRLTERGCDRIIGLGAQNPKGHAACVLAALEAIAAAGVPLRGRLLGAFGAGGMPTNPIAWSGAAGDEPVSGRRNTGHGVGASFLLEQGVWPDAAVIAKTGWSVSWAEVGVAWVDVTVRGVHTYVGARHRLPYRNPIVDAGRVAAHLDRWFAETYSPEHTDALVAPQGVVSASRSGWWRMAALVPAQAKLRCDVRLAPGQSPLDAWRELDAALDELRRGDEPIEVTSELALAIPGSVTPPDHWISSAAIAAWERIAGLPHRPPTAMSGATDANILRNRGIPTVRVGLPKSTNEGPELDFAAGMNTVDVDSLEQLTKLLVSIAADVCTRPRPVER